jgi:hypothetical protein
MKIVQSSIPKKLDLPLELLISFDKVVPMYTKYADESMKNHPLHNSSVAILKEFDSIPELRNGFQDESLLVKHHDFIDRFLDPLFPELLQENEIKAASLLFSFTSFKLTSRFQKILKNAGEDYDLSLRNLDHDMMYINACVYILAFHYHFFIDLKRPFFFDIPDATKNIMKHYRVGFNADFCDMIKTDKAPTLTEKDFHKLIDNIDDIDLWKEKFPPNSYIVKGIGLIHLFDVTIETCLSGIQTSLFSSKSPNVIKNIEVHLRNFFAISDLKIGLSRYDLERNDLTVKGVKQDESLILKSLNESFTQDFYCDYLIQSIFRDKKPLAISDLEYYGKMSNYNLLYKQLIKEQIGSILFIPIYTKKLNQILLIEIASPRQRELNSLNISKLTDIIEIFQAAVERFADEHQNTLEATIQEFYTSIHPTVKWRFYEAAEKYVETTVRNEKSTIEDIVFDQVYPLYGQSDIKGSSVARNNAIKEDLNTQLDMTLDVLDKVKNQENLPIYNELCFRLNKYHKDVNNGLKAGDEVIILNFFKKEIYPIFEHIQNTNPSLEKEIEAYFEKLDPELNLVYEKRKAYEDSVTLLNNELAQFIDLKQDEAQAMFPHYFERYKTDGVEYNMYIGQSLVKNNKYENLYLYNLRLWQLQLTCEMENIANKARQKMEHDLQVASLILVHSNSLAIKFRMDEKKFDVDGAYNIRYEIIKKRIDKAHIKNTTERLTQPGKISIVYSHDKDAAEYIKYISYLQHKNKLGKMEELELEDLQGVSGLKALRLEVIFDDNYDSLSTQSLKNLIQEMESQV